MGYEVLLHRSCARPRAPSTTIAEGDLVFAEASGRAELENGRVYEPHSAWVFRVEEGFIVEIKELVDTKHSYEVFSRRSVGALARSREYDRRNGSITPRTAPRQCVVCDPRRLFP